MVLRLDLDGSLGQSNHQPMGYAHVQEAFRGISPSEHLRGLKLTADRDLYLIQMDAGELGCPSISSITGGEACGYSI